MTTGMISGRTRGGDVWVPQFVTGLDGSKCIGCGRCYKVCPRDVFTLVDRNEVVEDDDMDDDDEMKVMTLKNPLDCIGCMSCSRVCPKQCHTHQELPA